jgi:beta-glucanase (GH16 family)
MAAQLLSTNNEPPTKIQATEEPLEKPTRPPPPSPVKHDYKLVWADEFDYEGLPHPKRWGYQVEANNWVHDRNHNEQQWYMASRRENSYVSGGTLKIIARREDWIGRPYTSARIRTRGKGDWVYGKLLVRAKLPAGKPGIWPAIWMMPTDQKYGSWPNSGEIDVMENVGWAPGVIHNSVHTGAFNHRLRSHKHAEVVVDDAHSAFHVYGVEWDEDSIKYSIDGQRTFEFVNTKSGNPAVESGVKINQ